MQDETPSPIELRRLLEEAITSGLTESSISVAVGVSQGHISKMRHGLVSWNTPSGRKLGRYLQSSEPKKRETELVSAVRALLDASNGSATDVIHIIHSIHKLIKPARGRK